MRTTLTIDDEIFAKVKEYASGQKLSVSRAVEDLLRRSLASEPRYQRTGRLTVVSLPANARRVTTRRVRQLEAAEH